MKTLKCGLLLVTLYLIASCADQSSLEVIEQGSLIRAANGTIYTTACLREAENQRDVASCAIDDTANKNRVSTQESATTRGAFGLNNYFDPYGYQNPLFGYSNGWNYSSSFLWNQSYFGQGAFDNFFNYPSSSVWGNNYGWDSFLYGQGYDNYSYTCGGNCNCNSSWLSGYSFNPGILGNGYLGCGSTWTGNYGYGNVVSP